MLLLPSQSILSKGLERRKLEHFASASIGENRSQNTVYRFQVEKPTVWSQMSNDQVRRFIVSRRVGELRIEEFRVFIKKWKSCS
jgi:hypothetical protein